MSNDDLDLVSDDDAIVLDDGLTSDGHDDTDDNPLTEEKRAINQEESDVPIGIAKSDLGGDEEWERDEWERGAGGKQDEDDVEGLGFQIVDGADKAEDISTYGEDL